MHKAWSSVEDVPYCFWRSSIKFQYHTRQKSAHFDPNWGFLECNLSLNSLMAMKWCTKIEAIQEKCSTVFLGHPSNCKVTRDRKIVDFDPNWVFPDCNLSLNSLTAMKWCTKLEATYIQQVPYCFSRSSIKLQGHTGQNITNFHLNWVLPDRWTQNSPLRTTNYFLTICIQIKLIYGTFLRYSQICDKKLPLVKIRKNKPKLKIALSQLLIIRAIQNLHLDIWYGGW